MIQSAWLRDLFVRWSNRRRQRRIVIKFTGSDEGADIWSDGPISIIGYYTSLRSRVIKTVSFRSCYQVAPYFMKKLAAVALVARLSLKSKSSHHSVKDAIRTTYSQLENHLSWGYAVDDIIAETHSDITCFIKPSPMSSLEFANAVWSKTFRCAHVYDEYVLNGWVQ